MTSCILDAENDVSELFGMMISPKICRCWRDEYIDREDREMKRIIFGEKKKEKTEKGPETQALIGEENFNENELAE